MMNLGSIKDRLKKLIARKYLVVTILFLAWLFFFDENSIVYHQRQRQQLREMLEQKEIYIKQIAADKEKLEDLRSGKEELERFAREQYLMAKPDEDVFIVEED